MRCLVFQVCMHIPPKDHVQGKLKQLEAHSEAALPQGILCSISVNIHTSMYSPSTSLRNLEKLAPNGVRLNFAVIAAN